jgi:hypothetical protein
VRFRALAALAAAGALALAGCGGDDEKDKAGADTETATERAETTTAATTETAPPPTETEPAETGPTRTGEDVPGGGGDEVENTVPAEIVGRGGKLTPARVSVAPFIRLSITLTSADGGVYELRGGGGSLQVGGPSGEDASTAVVDGLRPGRSVVLTGPQGSVRITANADPGP